MDNPDKIEEILLQGTLPIGDISGKISSNERYSLARMIILFGAKWTISPHGSSGYDLHRHVLSDICHHLF